MCEPLCPILGINSRDYDAEIDEDIVFRTNTKETATVWDWILPAAVRDIEVPVVKNVPLLDSIPTYSTESDDSSKSECLPTIDERDDEDDENDDDSYMSENSLEISVEKSYQLPPPEYFEIYSLPGAPSMNDDYDVDWDYLSKGMHNLPSPPSLTYNN